MGCAFSNHNQVKEKGLFPSATPKTQDRIEDSEILCLTEVSVPCVNTTNLSFQNQRTVSSRSKRDECVMENIMEGHYDFDLIYITERIISVFFQPDLEEQRYSSNLKKVAAMLKLKHQEKFLVINLSEKRHDICRLNPKVEEFGWPDLHAPTMDKICAMCKAMESWLNSDTRSVVVFYCKGNRGKTGVIIAAYMHYSKISAGADQALANVAMKKFCEDKISTTLQPSQNRYIYYFSGLLSGAIKINSSPLLLQQVCIPAIPNYQPGGGYAPFLKIYQSLKLIYTSDIYSATEASRNKTLCIRIEPALQLKGDIMVNCYHRRSDVHERECVFRVQFHTCTVHGAQLWFGKGELDYACYDERYPTDATVQLVFSPVYEQDRGGQIQKNYTGRSVDFSSTDSIVRWDSYENFNLQHQDSTEYIRHTRGPLDGSLYAQVKKRRVPDSCSNSSTLIKPSTCRQLSSPSSDSRHSITPLKISKDSSLSSPFYHNVKGEDRKQNGEREKSSVKEKNQETAILDDPHLRRERFCPGRPYSHPQIYCGVDLPNTHQQKLRPKHQTLPCTRASPSPVCEVCISQPDFMWERGHCKHHICTQTARPFYPYSSTETPNQSVHACTHTSYAHTLPAQARLLSSMDACPLFHYPSQSQNHTHQSLPSHEVCFSPAPPTLCSCRDCSHLREDLAHHIQINQFERLPWSRETELGYRREGPMHWARDKALESQGSEYWQHRVMMPSGTSSYRHRHCDSILNKDNQFYVSDRPDLTSSRYPSPHSSGYHSPNLNCPCSSPQISPGHASLDHSSNSSPVALTPSPKRTSHSQYQILCPVSYGKEHTLPTGDTDGTANYSPDRFSKNALSLQVLNSVTPPPEPEPEDLSSSETSQWKPYQISSVSSNGTANTKEPHQSEDVKSVSTTTLLNDPNQGSELSLTTHGKDYLVPIQQVQRNNPLVLAIIEQDTEENNNGSLNACQIFKSTFVSSQASTCHSDRSSISDFASIGNNIESLRLTPLTDGAFSNEDESSIYLRSPSPVPEGGITPSFPLASPSYPLLTVPHVPYTGYTSITIPACLVQPPLPEKQCTSPSEDSSIEKNSYKTSAELLISHHQPQNTSSLNAHTRRRAAPEPEKCVSDKFVQDSSKFWYKPGISRDQAIAVLKDKKPGCFLIRNSNSFHGAYGLALKVATPPPYSNSHGQTSHSPEQLVRHFLIESGAKGVKIKGCQNETFFGSLSALVYQHSITPVSLPCKLLIPDKDFVGELQDFQSGANTSTAADLLKQGAACNVLYVNSVDTESLTGPQAIAKAIQCTLTQDPLPSATVVHFKVSAQGITLTDNQRRLFFRKHYPIHSIIFSCVGPEDQRWTIADNTSNKMFGFVARRSGCGLANVCHLFAEIDPEQPASAIVNFINKVMLGPHRICK